MDNAAAGVPGANGGSLSLMAAIIVFAPSLNASIALINLIACIAADSSSAAVLRRNRLAAASASRHHPPPPQPSPRSSSFLERHGLHLSPAQSAILVASLISIATDLVMFYACVRASLDPLVVTAYITAVRFQIITGRLRPRRPILRPSGRAPPTTILRALAENPPALVATAVYTALSAAAVALQIQAYADNDWDQLPARASPAFVAYRAVALVATCAFAGVALYTDAAISPKRQQQTVPVPAVTVTDVDAAAAPAAAPHRPKLSPSSTSPPPPPPPPPHDPDPLTRVKKYYNHALHLAYELVLLAAYVVLAVAFFFDAAFTAAAYVEQALMAYVAWNGYTLLHAAAAVGEGGGGGGGGAGGERGVREEEGEEGEGVVEAGGAVAAAAAVPPVVAEQYAEEGRAARRPATPVLGEPRRLPVVHQAPPLPALASRLRLPTTTTAAGSGVGTGADDVDWGIREYESGESLVTK
ncbi:hypothetical protein DFJ73DRAFT_943439 [Zopfochytrium polystomum]|nr:hypothetical protein DFJ73DRAFT_943439 [Zopfochytrium polystomum]